MNDEGCRMKIDNKKGFTLIELMAVIALIMVLVGLLMPALKGIRKKSKEKQSVAECMAIKSAIISYKVANRQWPDSRNGDLDRVYGDEDGNDDNSTIITLLIDNNDLVVGDLNKDDDDNVFDPWGAQYIIKLDTDYDGRFSIDSTNAMPEGVEVSSITYPESEL